MEPIMEQHKKSINICICILSLLFAFEIQAKKSDRAPSAEVNQVQEVHLENQGPTFPKKAELRSPWFLQKLLPFNQVNDALDFWQGMQFIQNEDFNQSHVFLNQIKSDSWFYVYAQFFLMKNFYQNQKYTQALEVAERVSFVSKNLKNKINSDIFWLKLEILGHLKQGARIRNELKSLGKIDAEDRFVKIQKEFILGFSDLLAGDKNEAIKHFTHILVHMPGTGLDERIFDLAKKYSLTQNELLPKPMMYLRAENLIDIGFADLGYEIYKSLDGDDETLIERKALALFRARRYEEAQFYFEKIIEQGLNTEMGPYQTMVRLAQCYTRTDQFEKAIAMYRLLAEKFPGSNYAERSDVAVANLLFDAGRFEEALQRYNKILAFQKTDLQNLWMVFWSYYLSKNWEKALESGESYLSLAPAKNENRRALIYFLGRVCEKLKKSQQAKNYYQKLQNADSLDYYKLLAQQRLKYSSLEEGRLIQSDLLNGWDGWQSKINDDDYSRLFKENSKLGEAYVLTELGLDEYATDALDGVRDFVRNRADVALSLIALGGGRESYLQGFSKGFSSQSGCTQDCLYTLRFPKAYANYVERFSAHWGLDSHLAYAIMRQESAFQARVISKAFAYGLMQIIPPTGQDIARDIGYPNFHPDDLTKPDVNILFGTKYLKTLSDTFSGHLAPTIAAYNAGPYNVSRWLKRNHHEEWDEFIELIPYSETKNYVKKVLVNYWVYEGLYQ